MSQFQFLQAEFADIHDPARKAETLAVSDPRAACFYARLALEVAVKWMYEHDRTLRAPYETTLAARIQEPTFRMLAGDTIVTKARLIKNLGNKAAHETGPVQSAKAVTALRELFHVCYWLVRTYARGEKPPPGVQFDAGKLAQIRVISASTAKQIRKLQDDFRARETAFMEEKAARLKTESEREKLEAEIKTLQEAVAKARKANQTAPDTHDYNEAQTRDAFIDLLLHEAGWKLDQPRDIEFPVTGMPNTTGEGFVDYVLWGDDGKPLGLVEAKRVRRDARDGQRQAELYADALERQFGQRPVIFCSNGYEHWIWDDRRYPPRAIQGFLTKDELALTLQRRSTLKPLAPEAINPNIVERYYQTRAIRRIAEAFEKDKLRKVLLVMATGSGKTRTVIALSDLLMRANWAKRILFLADRVALVNQAVGAFKTFLPQASPVNLVTDKSAHGRVYVATYPTMMGLIDEMKGTSRRFGPGHFDLIVIDEAHRSVYRKYKAIFDYFDSLLVGLTATPKDEVDRDTYALFDLQSGIPTDVYGLDEAVQDGFLVPPKAVSVPLKFQREGIRYHELSQQEKENWETIEWDEDGSIPDHVDAAAVNKWLFNQDTVDKVLAHVMTNGLKVDDGDRLGKTIIFAKNHDHAQFIADRFDASYPHLKGRFARVIDFKTEYAQSLIDNFSIADKAPHIAISVDMLDTGIDVPEVVNLVFFKIVRSKTKFWQMIGRGTRLCPDLFGMGAHKDHFRVFDFCQNFEFFNQNPDVTGGAVGGSLTEKLFIARVELAGELTSKPDQEEDDGHAQLHRDVIKRLRDEVAGMNVDNFIVRPKRRLVEKYRTDAPWQALGPEERTELIEELAGLPSALMDEDHAAKQFDYLILSAQLVILRCEKGLKSLKKRVIELASALEELENVPMVAKQMALILEIQTDAYWQDVTPALLETARHRLRDLIKLIELKKRPHIYTDFEDEIGAAEAIAVQGVTIGTDMNRFQMKARHFLQEHADHITIRKLRRNEPLTAQDLKELERVFIAAGVAEQTDLEKVRADGGLGVFVRSLIGLDREAAKQAFDRFQSLRTLSANQIEFLNMIIDHLTERGVMDPGLLYESPFTDLDAMGVEGIFKSGDVVELVDILEEVRKRAAA